MEEFQKRVKQWSHDCFGETIANDKIERIHRFVEEALELAQSCGCTKSEVEQLVNYVYNRPVGEMEQEIGGVIVTLNAFCNAYDVSLNDAAYKEYDRIYHKIDKIREKQRKKPKFSAVSQMMVSQIVAISNNYVIGDDLRMLWHMPEDFKYFKRTTLGHHVLMGRNTYLALGKPLKDRVNIVVSQDKNFTDDNVVVVRSIQEGIEYARNANEIELFIIGGDQIYEQTQHLCDLLYVTEIDVNVEGNKKYPRISDERFEEFERVEHSGDEKNIYNYTFVKYRKK